MGDETYVYAWNMWCFWTDGKLHRRFAQTIPITPNCAVDMLWLMGATLCGYAVSLILHIALWQLFASMIILVCRFMVVMVVIGAKKEA